MKLLQVVDGQLLLIKSLFCFSRCSKRPSVYSSSSSVALTHWLTKRHCFAARPFFIVDRNVAKRGVDFYWVPWGLSQNHMMLGWAIRLDYDPSLYVFSLSSGFEDTAHVSPCTEPRPCNIPKEISQMQ